VATVSPGLASNLVVGFLVEPQNQGGGGSSGLGLKTDSSGLVIWASKSPLRFLGLSVASQNRWSEVDTGHASRSSGLLHMEASLGRVCQSDMKTDKGATAGGVRGNITEVASEAS
jgi:hypothetical protein